MKHVRHVLIVGGVHGNELNGVYLVKTLEPQRSPLGQSFLERSHLTATTLLANPEAIRLNRRYVDTDLNRCFDRDDLANPDLRLHEQQVAKQIYHHVQAQPIDFVVDLHTTTANMGLTLILSSDHPLNVAIAAHLSTLSPLVKILLLSPQSATNRLRGLCSLGFTLEAGAIAQGTLDARLFFESRRLLGETLDFWNRCNQGERPTLPSEVTVYEHVQTLDFPRNADGEAIAMVHPDRQGQDYGAIAPSDPLFIGFDGSVIAYEGDEILHPIFIHESAYWEKGIAMYLAQKKTLPVSPF
ncbi:MAG: aspartoacylase [Leptolyngbyaceae bacterium]|nr:aspartoacylase [Leptolyngbyaceae bacterium]